MSHDFDPNAAAGPGSGVFGLDHDPDQAAVCLLPVPFDATTSYRRGAARGPEAILAASRQVDLYDPLLGDPWKKGIWMAPIDKQVREWNTRASRRAHGIIECGGEIGDDPALAADLEAVNAIGGEVNEWVREHTTRALEAGMLVGVVGGDHATPYGSIIAHAERYPGMGILHFDAHADLREAYEGFRWSHASILHNVGEGGGSIRSLLQVGIRDLCEAEAKVIAASDGRLHTVFDHEWADVKHAPRDIKGLVNAVARTTNPGLRELVRDKIARLPEEVYITFDIDALEPSLCPNTGTPVPGGLTWHDTMLWLGELVESGRRIVGFDLVEVAPGSDRPSGEGLDEIIGARLLYRLIGFALRSRG